MIWMALGPGAEEVELMKEHRGSQGNTQHGTGEKVKVE